MFLSTDRTVRLHLARSSVDFPVTRDWRQGQYETNGFPVNDDRRHHYNIVTQNLQHSEIML